jgi:tagaturonate reductase
MISTPIVQFGTSRFLQAHVDLFVHEAAQTDQQAGPITVVASSGSPQGKARLKALADPDGYPVVVKGLDAGQQVELELRVRSIRRALDAETDWRQLTRVFIEDARFVVSNTTEGGFYLPDNFTVQLAAPIEAAPPYYPAKLLALLAARQRVGAGPVTVLPTELIARNGDELRRTVGDLARRSGASDPLMSYIEDECIFANSLVDRIVSAALEPAGAVAEPYALWAIERRIELDLPCVHPAIATLDDLEPLQRLKLHILNLGHTVMAELWQTRKLPHRLTVREILSDRDCGAFLREVYEREVLPGFRAREMGDQAKAYLATTVDRFANPFLDHRLSDIAANHREKVLKRIHGFMTWTGLPRTASMSRLAAICKRNAVGPEHRLPSTG